MAVVAVVALVRRRGRFVRKLVTRRTGIITGTTRRMNAYSKRLRSTDGTVYPNVVVQAQLAKKGNAVSRVGNDTKAASPRACGSPVNRRVSTDVGTSRDDAGRQSVASITGGFGSPRHVCALSDHGDGARRPSGIGEFDGASVRSPRPTRGTGSSLTGSPGGAEVQSSRVVPWGTRTVKVQPAGWSTRPR